MSEPEKTIAHSEIQLNDDKFRMIGIPFFGILIPNATGLFGNLPLTSLAYWLGYIHFILLAFLFGKATAISCFARVSDSRGLTNRWKNSSS